MKERWVKRKMNKALTLITLTSTVALMSPMIVQTGSIVYASSQDQPTVLVDTKTGKLDYTYQTDDANIHWSLSVNEKEAADSAYLRLKIDSVNSINVAGQSVGKDESGWFVLDAAIGSAKSYQVDFVTANNGSQELPVTAELVTPGEEGAEDQVQSLVTNGTLKAEIPVVTELPEVSSDVADNSGNEEANLPSSSVETDDTNAEDELSNPTPSEEVENKTDISNNQLNNVQSADENPDVIEKRDAVEITPFGVENNKLSHTLKKNGGGEDLIDNGSEIGTKFISVGDEVTFTTIFRVTNANSEHNWHALLDKEVFDLPTTNISHSTTQSKITVRRYYGTDGRNWTERTGDNNSWKYDASTGRISTSNTLTANSYKYYFRFTVTVKVKPDLQLSEPKQVDYQSDVSYKSGSTTVYVPARNASTNYDKYWVAAGNRFNLRNQITDEAGNNLITKDASIGEQTPYANAGDKVTFTSSYTLAKNNGLNKYVWSAALDANVIDESSIRVNGKSLTEAGLTKSIDTENKRIILTAKAIETTRTGEIPSSAVSEYRITATLKSDIATDTNSVFSSKLSYETGEWKWEWSWDWNEWGYQWSGSAATPIEPSNKYWVKAVIDNPTYLSWDEIGDDNEVTTTKTVNNHVIGTPYTVDFYWKDLDTADGLHFMMYKGDTLVGSTGDGRGGTGNKMDFTILQEHLNDSTNEFTLGVYTYIDGRLVEVESSNRLTLTINCDNPTVLSWKQDTSQTILEETKDIADLTSGYTGTFYWEDQDESDNDPGALTFKVFKEFSETDVVAIATQKPDGSGSFNIPSDELGYGVKNFTVQTYKGDEKTGAPITLQINVNGSVKLQSVPTDLSWNMTVEHSKGAAISRSGDMTLKVQDSRSAAEKASNPWKLTVSSQLQNTPFSLVWQDGETLVDGVELQKTESWTSDKFVDSKTYGADQGILLKSTDYLPVDTWNHPGAITWSLNNVGTTE